ncbi:immunoglobulin superfamily member 5-like [Brachionichthys hirsutus]|uniref:immunoglobulin superfamily member 5-like n=1 Tax=Brachionichthys hirsutus TaxID=412623 RepID=UPI0036047ED3
MTASWTSCPDLVACLLLCATTALSQDFQLQPLNSTVLRGFDARFNATVQGKWEVMTWHVKGLLVLSVSNRVFFNVTSSSPQFSARPCTNGNVNCVAFTIHNVTRSQAGPIVCSVLGHYGFKTAQLQVEESGTVSIVGGNVTAVQDQQVAFQCMTSDWFPAPNISWSLNGEPANGSLFNTSNVPDGDVFNSTSVLSFQAVSNATVACWGTVSMLPNPISSSSFLAVVPKPPDWTVLIAVVVSFGSAGLLVLLIFGIVFCCRRRKEKKPNYQDEMSKRVRTQSQVSSVSAAGQGQGQVNAGYVLDGQTNAAPSQHSDSGFSQRNGQELPDFAISSQAGNDYKMAYNTLDEPGLRKHRHVTIV